MSSNKDKDVPMVNGALFFVLAYGRTYKHTYTDGRTDGGTYVHTDSHVTTKNFEINGLPNFPEVHDFMGLYPYTFDVQGLHYIVFAHVSVSNAAGISSDISPFIK